jgi:hypothetical protein
MKAFRLPAFLILLPPLFAAGCVFDANTPPAQDKEAKIKAALGQLDPADRKLAEEQKYCAVKTENRLGVMGKPVKITIKDQPVFLCCEGCEKAAKADPDKTLARVEEVQIKAALELLDPADRKLAEAQKFCAVESENRLGAMGKPIKVMVKDQPVFICCKGCEKAAKADPDKTLATVKKLKETSADKKK